MSQLPVRNIRLTGRPSTYYERLVGSPGEVYYDNTLQALRIYPGNIANGKIIADRNWVAAQLATTGGSQPGVAGKIAYYSATGTQVNDLTELSWTADTSTLLLSGTINVTGQKNRIRFHWDTLADLTSEVPAADYHGMVAHAHDTGKLYYAHAGAWLPVASEAAIPNTFSTIAVAGQNSLAADSPSTTLTLVAGTGITLTTNAGTETLTITGTASTGNITFAANVIDTTDSTAISFTPSVAFDSDVVVGNEIVFSDGTRQRTSSIGITGPQGIEGPPGPSGTGTGDVLSAGGAYVDNSIVRYNGTTGTIIQVSSASVSDAGVLSATNFSGGGAAITALNATQLTTGTVPNARFPATLPAASGINLTALNAAQLTTGTVPDARFPATLPAASGTNLTALNAAQLTTGTVPIGRIGASGTPSASTYLRGDNAWATVSGGGSSNSFETIVVAGQISVVADSATDSLTLVAGSGIVITTDAGTDSVTITATAGGGGTVTTASVVSANGFAGTVTTASTTPAITISTSITGVLKGNGTAISAAAAGTDYQAVIALTTSGTSGAATFNGTILNIPQYGADVGTFSALTDASTAGATVDEFYLPAITALAVTNNGASSYRFDQYSTADNPTIYAISGTTIAFRLSVSGHPFLIRTAGGSNYDTGLNHVTTTGTVTTGSSAQGKESGTLYWKIPAGISGNYQYICSIHGSMIGVITVVDNATSLGSFTSAQLAAALTDETGSGANVFATSPTLVSPALGTPSSGVVTNLTGTASININGTVGATTPAAGAFTSLSASGATTLSGGTANGVTYLNGSKVLTSGSALTFDGSAVALNTSTTSDALRIAQTGTGNAFVVEDSTSPDSTPFVIDATGTVINGHTTGITGYSDRGVAQQVLQGGGQINAVYSTSVASPAIYEAARSRSATVGSHTVVQDNDWLGYWVASGSDGTQFIRAAAIVAQVDGTPGTNNMPGRLVFSTTAAGGSSPTERLRIDSAGNVGIATTTPEYRLDVTATDNVTTTSALAVQNSSRNYGVGIGAYTLTNRNIGGAAVTIDYTFDIGGATIFKTAAAERMRINSAGNVGIGTSSPGAKLDVNLIGTASLANTVITSVDNFAQSARYGTGGLVNNNDGTYFGMGAGGGISAGIGFFREAVGWNSALAFYTNNITSGPDGTRAIQEKMRINSAGNVGIGTSSPADKLHVLGKGRFEGVGSFEALELITSDANRVYITGNSTISGDMWRVGTSISNPNLVIDALQANSETIFRTGGQNERMRITSAGNVLLTGGFTPTNASRLFVRGFSGASYNNNFSQTNATVQIVSDEMSVNQWYPTLNVTMVRQSLTTGNGAFGGIGFSTIDDSNNSGMDDAGRIAIVNEIGSAVASGTAMAFYTQVGSVTRTNPAAERMRINSAGNVGIGTSSPAVKLDVVGAISSTTDATLSGVRVGKGAGAISSNTALGSGALNSNTTGSSNTANGLNALTNNTTGNNNTASGTSALTNNTTGTSNTANGYQALFYNTTGYSNTANGANALLYNTTGYSNTANGVNALQLNTTGGSNTANGFQALRNNTTTVGTLGAVTGGTGYTNGTYTAVTLTRLSGSTIGTAPTGTVTVEGGVVTTVTLTTPGTQFQDTTTILTASAASIGGTGSGFQVLVATLLTGINNTASGVNALNANTTGGANTANGYQALQNNTTGNENTASGQEALRNNTTGSNNTASGRSALNANTTGSGNTAINPLNSAGSYAPVFNPTTENNRFCMGSAGVTNAYIQVAWTVVSDARDKTNFAPVPHGLEFVKALQPTAYQFRTARDSEETNGGVRYGFKAQDVLALEGANPVIVDNEDADKLRMIDTALIPVLVKALQELNAKFDAYVLTHP